MTNRAPLIAAITLLLLPLLYVGSYLALVKPPNVPPVTLFRINTWGTYPYPLQVQTSPYRYGGRSAEIVFWPIEQLDRKWRPDAWRIWLRDY